MGIIIRQSIWVTIFSYLGVVIGYFNVLWLYPTALSVDEIGLFRMVTDAAMLLVPFAQLGLGHGLMKFYPTLSREKRRIFLGTLLLVTLAAFLLFLILFIVFKPLIMAAFQTNASQVNDFLDVILALTFILVAYNFLESFARAVLRVIFVNFVKDVVMRLLSSLLVTLYFFQFITLSQVIYGLLVVYGSAVLLVGIYYAINEKIQLSFRWKALPSGTLKNLLIFSLITFLGTSGSLLILKLDSLMVGSMLGLDANGIYTTVFYVALVIEMPRRAVTQLATPLFSRAFNEDHQEEVADIYQKSALNQLIIGLILFVGIVFNLQNLFWLMPRGDEFAAGFWVVVLIGASKVIDMAFGSNNELILMSKHYRFLILGVLVLGIFTILTNLWLIPRYQLEGAALASLLSLTIFNVLKAGFIYHIYRMQPFTKNALLALLFAGLAALCGWLLPQLPNALLDIAYRSFIMGSIFTTGILTTRTSPEIHQAIQDVRKRLNSRD